MPIERSQKREIIQGGAAMGCAVILFLGIFFLADVKRMFTRTDTLYVLMPSAAGLNAGSVVWLAGQPVGEVKAIEVRPPGTDTLQRVLITIDVESRHREHIRHDSDVRVTSARLIGDAVLDISPGTPNAPPVAENDSLRLRITGSPAAAIARARVLNAQLRQLVADSRTLGEQSRRARQNTERLRERLAVTMREFTSFVETMQHGPLNTFSDPEFNSLLSSLGATIQELRDSFQRAGERARRTRQDAGPAFNRLAARADTIQREIARLQEAINTGGGGLLVRAQKDSAIIKGLHRAQIQLDSLIAETKSNPLRFWF
jgi:ABC-type transporter Mla subunit MlaD